MCCLLACFCLDKTGKRHCRILFFDNLKKTAQPPGVPWAASGDLAAFFIGFASFSFQQENLGSRSGRGQRGVHSFACSFGTDIFQLIYEKLPGTRVCKHVQIMQTIGLQQPTMQQVCSAMAFLCFSCHCSMRQHVELSLSLGFSSAA